MVRKGFDSDVEGNIPYITVDGAHYAVLCLLDSHIKTLGLTITGRMSWGLAYGTIRVHLDDGL